VLKPSGREIKHQVYIILEYIEGQLLFEVCDKLGGMGETAGRFFMNQLLDALTYMHRKGVVHRDLKLENILVDEHMNIKVVDFGFATYKNIKKLNSYKGTKTYMAPEIRKGLVYDGRQVDIFSTGVILFTIVHGIFPFKEATETDSYYGLLCEGETDKYWDKVAGTDFSPEFQDLILSMFSENRLARPTLDEIREHPWLKSQTYDHELVRKSLLEEYHEKKAEESGATASTAVTKEDEERKKVKELVEIQSPHGDKQINDM